MVDCDIAGRAQYCSLYLLTTCRPFGRASAQYLRMIQQLTQLVKKWRPRALVYQRTLTQPQAGPGPGECCLTQRRANIWL